ncbi:squalene/phytoene synthase family protein [Roseicitreum antarcticum]|uniref:Squalene/phytoene synthase n=1 Tax=Roseicitreum antarcticum TaxID=564137 RepID=A0A1H3A8F0_9RHOB|nr:squalene/phytoene synthase family protein [Roseicitreum antarcticum]SDX25578.1 Squalene/phytoene synthase [Roseicitreum antarcticum]
MSLDLCAAQVERGDADRFAATMAAPVAVRDRLWPLYALNLEVARAPWVTAEPMIAEMRLQFWHDTIDDIANGKPARAHEVAQPLADVIRAHALPPEPFHALIAARRWDIYTDAFADAQAFDAHIDATSGNLMWLAALTLDAPAQAEPVLRDLAYAMGVAGWLQAIPALDGAGRIPLIDGTPAGVAALAQTALARLHRARANRARVPAHVTPAALPAWRSGAILHHAARYPQTVAIGGLVQPEFTRRGSLLLRALSGRW